MTFVLDQNQNRFSVEFCNRTCTTDSRLVLSDFAGHVKSPVKYEVFRALVRGNRVEWNGWCRVEERPISFPTTPHPQ